MEPITLSAPALLVAWIYCVYTSRRREQERQTLLERRLRERVAFMLWIAAHEVDHDE